MKLMLDYHSQLEVFLLRNSLGLCFIFPFTAGPIVSRRLLTKCLDWLWHMYRQICPDVLHQTSPKRRTLTPPPAPRSTAPHVSLSTHHRWRSPRLLTRPRRRPARTMAVPRVRWCRRRRRVGLYDLRNDYGYGNGSGRWLRPRLSRDCIGLTRKGRLWRSRGNTRQGTGGVETRTPACSELGRSTQVSYDHFLVIFLSDWTNKHVKWQIEVLYEFMYHRECI